MFNCWMLNYFVSQTPTCGQLFSTLPGDLHLALQQSLLLILSSCGLEDWRLWWMMQAFCCVSWLRFWRCSGALWATWLDALEVRVKHAQVLRGIPMKPKYQKLPQQTNRQVDYVGSWMRETPETPKCIFSMIAPSWRSRSVWLRRGWFVKTVSKKCKENEMKWRPATAHASSVPDEMQSASSKCHTQDVVFIFSF